MVGERRGKYENVDVGEDFVDGIGGEQFFYLRRLGAGPPVRGDDFGVEGAEDFGQAAAVAAEADDADAGAVQVAGGAADEFAFLLGSEVGGEAAQEGGGEGDGVVGHLVGEDAGGAGDGDVRLDHGRDQDVVQAGGGGLDPVQTLAAADFVPGDGDFGMAAENVGVEQLFGDVFLAGVDDFITGGVFRDLSDVVRLDRVAEDESFATGNRAVVHRAVIDRWRLGLAWHTIGCCQPRLFWQVLHQADRVRATHTSIASVLAPGWHALRLCEGRGRSPKLPRPSRTQGVPPTRSTSFHDRRPPQNSWELCRFWPGRVATRDRVAFLRRRGEEAAIRSDRWQVPFGVLGR